jgi:hypothetical protein
MWHVLHFRKEKTVHFLALAVSLIPGHAVAQVDSRWPLTMEAQVHNWVSPCGICGGQSDTGTGFLRNKKSTIYFFMLQLSYSVMFCPVSVLFSATHCHSA